MTKKEIIHAIIKPLAPTKNLTIADCMAMDHYAKQVAIGFAEWRINARAHWSYHYDIWSLGGETYTTAELYDLYINSLK
jgi:hypothetical protein